MGTSNLNKGTTTYWLYKYSIFSGFITCLSAEVMYGQVSGNIVCSDRSIWINRGILQSPIINGNTCYQKHIPHRERTFICYLAPLAFLSHLNLGESMRNSETLVEVKAPRHRPSKRLRINHKIMEYFYSTAPILLPYQQCSSIFMGDYSWSSARRTLS